MHGAAPCAKSLWSALRSQPACVAMDCCTTCRRPHQQSCALGALPAGPCPPSLGPLLPTQLNIAVLRSSLQRRRGALPAGPVHLHWRPHPHPAPAGSGALLPPPALRAAPVGDAACHADATAMSSQCVLPALGPPSTPAHGLQPYTRSASSCPTFAPQAASGAVPCLPHHHHRLLPPGE